jgi:hypothetical protein
VTVPAKHRAQLIVGAHLEDGEYLLPAAAIVVAKGVLEPEGDQTLFDRRNTPEIVGSRDVVNLAAEEQPWSLEQRPFDAERIARIVTSEFVRDRSVDEGVVEVAVIEDRRGEADRRRQRVDRRIEILAPTGSRGEIGVRSMPVEPNRQDVAAGPVLEHDVSLRADRSAARFDHFIDGLADGPLVVNVPRSDAEALAKSGRSLL